MAWHHIRQYYRFQQGLLGGLRRYILPYRLGGISPAQYEFATKLYALASHPETESFTATSFMGILGHYANIFNDTDTCHDVDLLQQLFDTVSESEWVKVLPSIIEYHSLLAKLNLKEKLLSILNKDVYKTSLNEALKHYKPKHLSANELAFFIRLKQQLSLLTRKALAFLFRKHQVPLAQDNELYSIEDERRLVTHSLKAGTKTLCAASDVLSADVLIQVSATNAATIKQLLLKKQDKHELLYNTLVLSNQQGKLDTTVERFKQLGLPLQLDSQSLCLLMIKQAEHIKTKSDSGYTDMPWQKLFSKLQEHQLVGGVFAALTGNFYKSAAERENLSTKFEPAEWLAFLKQPESLKALYAIDDFYPLKIALQKCLLNIVKELIKPHLEKMNAPDRQVMRFTKAVNDLFSGNFKSMGRVHISEQVRFIGGLSLSEKYGATYRVQVAVIRQFINALPSVCDLYEHDPGIKAFKAQREREQRDIDAKRMRKEAKRYRLANMFREVKSGELTYTTRDELETICTEEGVFNEELYNQQCLLFSKLNALL